MVFVAAAVIVDRTQFNLFDCVKTCKNAGMAQHILIVEDDRTTRLRLAAYLREQGHRVSEAENAPEMEQIIELDPPELLLVDINLEGKDGLTITREQRSASRIGIILLTARDDQVDKIVGPGSAIVTAWLIAGPALRSNRPDASPPISSGGGRTRSRTPS